MGKQCLGVQTGCLAWCWIQPLLSSAAPLLLSTFHQCASMGTHRHLRSAPGQVDDAVSGWVQLVGARRTWKEQEVNEATGAHTPSVASFTSCSFPIWVSPPARWKWQLASVSTAPPSSLLSVAATCHPSVLPMGAQCVSSCSYLCHRLRSPFCMGMTQKMTAVMTVVLTIGLPSHLHSLQVFWGPHTLCKSYAIDKMHQKWSRTGSNCAEPQCLGFPCQLLLTNTITTCKCSYNHALPDL